MNAVPGKPKPATRHARPCTAERNLDMPMNVSFSADELAFRDEVRSFLAEKYPDDLRRKQDKALEWSRDDQIRWQKILYQQGWAALNWPVEYGGTGWSVIQKYIFANELAQANAPDMLPFGVKMVAPVIYTFGNEQQKKRFLPDILQSNVWWCQGYSEAGSGSDLASLKTKADRQGDHYLVNGTKTWTTLGQLADWIFCLVRTSSDVARRQEGISFLLIDMTSPGVSVKPIITIEGDHEVNEIHFQDVEVPLENLIGEEGKGWTYGKLQSVRKRHPYYSWQHDDAYRAWKYFPGIRSEDAGGHYPVFPQNIRYRISPRKFVLRHYRFRNINQALSNNSARIQRLRETTMEKLGQCIHWKLIDENGGPKITNHELLDKYNANYQWNREGVFHPYIVKRRKKNEIFDQNGKLIQFPPTRLQALAKVKEKQEKIVKLKKKLESQEKANLIIRNP